MDYVAIQATLEDHLDVVLGVLGLDVNKENSDFTPTTGQAYASPVFLPAQPTPAALGATADNRCHGIFQVTVTSRKGEGRGPALAAGTSIANHFRRGLELITSDSKKVTITSSGTLPAMPSDSSYSVPVDIHWTSDQPN